MFLVFPYRDVAFRRFPPQLRVNELGVKKYPDMLRVFLETREKYRLNEESYNIIQYRSQNEYDANMV